MVTFTDGGLGGTFGNPTVTTGANGTATTTYTLPPGLHRRLRSATNSKYSTASFTETATAATQL